MSRVLLIEDHPEQRELYATLLYYNGFDVDAAGTPYEGMTALKKNPPDLVIVDYRLPEMDGLFVARQLKDNPATAHIPIICISAFKVPESLLKDSGVQAFLAKPIAGDDLVRAIRKIIPWTYTREDEEQLTRRALVIAPRNLAIVEPLTQSLMLERFRVFRAADGASGLGVASTLLPDLIVVDVDAPVIDGWSVLTRLRQGNTTSKIPTFAISRSPSDAEEQKALAAGFNAYIKHVDRENIAAEVDRHVTV